jgi:hypothetical protein
VAQLLLLDHGRWFGKIRQALAMQSWPSLSGQVNVHAAPLLGRGPLGGGLSDTWAIRQWRVNRIRGSSVGIFDGEGAREGAAMGAARWAGVDLVDRARSFMPLVNSNQCWSGVKASLAQSGTRFAVMEDTWKPPKLR